MNRIIDINAEKFANNNDTEENRILGPGEKCYYDNNIMPLKLKINH
jgi:hypothetical protein